MQEFDPYEELGIESDATEEQVRTAFKALAKTLHPDIVGQGDLDEECSREVNERFARIKRAFDLLMDGRARAEYDQFGFMNGDEKSELAKDATRFLCDGFTQMIEGKELEELAGVDLLFALRLLVAEQVKAAQKTLFGLEADLKKRERRSRLIKGRLKRKQKGPNMFAGILDKQVKDQRNAVADAVFDLKVKAEAFRLLEGYTYDHPQASNGDTLVRVIARVTAGPR